MTILPDAAGRFVCDILRDASVEWPWAGDETAAAAFLDEAGRHRVEGLLAWRLKSGGGTAEWPDAVVDTLNARLREDTVREQIVQRELAATLDALNRAGIRSLLMKGAALAQTVYPAPALRRRGDTDLMIARADLDRAAVVLAEAGYRRETALPGERIGNEALFRKVDRHGFVHDLDVHWKISNRPMFEDILTWDELDGASIPVPALGPFARAFGPIHALTLACVHPVAHHGGEVGKIRWSYDVHLLLRAMSGADVDRWVDLVTARRIRSIAAHGLRLARERFGTEVPERVLAAFANGEGEPSAWFLSSEPWRGDVRLSDLRTVPGLRAKAQLVREVVLPRPSYIREVYGVTNTVPLPFLYLHRVVRGCWRLLQRWNSAPHVASQR